MESNEIILQSTTVEKLLLSFKEVIKDALEERESNSLSLDSELMTSEEVCEFLSITKSTLWKRTKDGKLQSYGQGRRIYYKKSEVLNSLKPLLK